MPEVENTTAPVVPTETPAPAPEPTPAPTPAPAETKPEAKKPMYPEVISYENETTGEMWRFHVVDNETTWIIDAEVVESEPPRQFQILKQALAVIYPHARDDFPALMDFIQSAWVFAKPPRVSHALIQPDERQIKIGQIAHKFAKELLEAMNVVDFADFANLSKTIEPYTVLYADQKAAKEKEKADKKAQKAATRTVEQQEKAAKKKAERDADKAKKKAERDAEKAKKKAEKDAETAKNKAERQKDMQAKIDAAKAANVGKEQAPTAPVTEAKPKATRGKKTVTLSPGVGQAPIPRGEPEEVTHVGDGWREGDVEAIKNGTAHADGGNEEGEDEKSVADTILAENP